METLVLLYFSYAIYDAYLRAKTNAIALKNGQPVVFGNGRSYLGWTFGAFWGVLFRSIYEGLAGGWRRAGQEIDRRRKNGADTGQPGTTTDPPVDGRTDGDAGRTPRQDAKPVDGRTDGDADGAPRLGTKPADEPAGGDPRPGAQPVDEPAAPAPDEPKAGAGDHGRSGAASLRRDGATDPPLPGEEATAPACTGCATLLPAGEGAACARCERRQAQQAQWRDQRLYLHATAEEREEVMLAFAAGHPADEQLWRVLQARQAAAAGTPEPPAAEDAKAPEGEVRAEAPVFGGQVRTPVDGVSYYADDGGITRVQGSRSDRVRWADLPSGARDLWNRMAEAVDRGDHAAADSLAGQLSGMVGDRPGVGSTGRPRALPGGRAQHPPSAEPGVAAAGTPAVDPAPATPGGAPTNSPGDGEVVVPAPGGTPARPGRPHLTLVRSPRTADSRADQNQGGDSQPTGPAYPTPQPPPGADTQEEQRGGTHPMVTTSGETTNIQSARTYYQQLGEHVADDILSQVDLSESTLSTAEMEDPEVMGAIAAVREQFGQAKAAAIAVVDALEKHRLMEEAVAATPGAANTRFYRES